MASTLATLLAVSEDSELELSLELLLESLCWDCWSCCWPLFLFAKIGASEGSMSESAMTMAKTTMTTPVMTFLRLRVPSGLWR